MKSSFILFSAILALITLSAKAQETTPKITQLLQEPKSYVIHKTSDPITIDGLGNENDWKKAEWTSYFKDIEGDAKPNPTYATRTKMLWDNEYLYIYAELEEPHIWGSLKNHDDIIFHDNDFEVFISNEEFAQEYFELEINTLGTIFDLLLGRPYRNGGKAIIDWDIKGLKSAVHIEGTLNDPTDTDKYWAVEFAIPFKSISLSGHTKKPKEGDLWRINFSRVQWQHIIKDGKYEKRRGENGRFIPENNWVWSPQGLINMHFPERWGYLSFSETPPSLGKKPSFKLPEKEKVKQIAWLMYYLQKEYYNQNKKYSSNTQELIDRYPEVSTLMKNISIKSDTGEDWFIIKVLKPGTDMKYMIDHHGILSPLK